MDLPKILSSSVSMNEPNETLLIHKGEFELANNEFRLIIEGELYFSWAPSPGVKYKGTVIEGVSSIQQFYKIPMQEFDLYIDGLIFGQSYVNIDDAGTDRALLSVSGSISGSAIKGDSAIPVDSVRFAIPNLREFSGEFVQDGNYGRANRLNFTNNDYEITLDKRPDFKEALKKLKVNGGYILTYYGELKNKNGAVKYNELNDLIRSFLTFLSFLNGRRCAPYFLQGMCDNKIVWTDYKAYFVDPYKYVHTWPPTLSNEGIAEIWTNFSELWKKDLDIDFLNTAIHWYVEANQNSGFAEGSIVMVQTALELIYNWLLIERKKVIIGKDAENISASNKIRLLLSSLGISSNFPNSYQDLKALKTQDAPEAFVQIRNAIVHSQEAKRMKLLKIKDNAKIEALHLGIWYIELSLLKILGYSGQYVNRTSSFGFQKSVSLPWSSENW